MYITVYMFKLKLNNLILNQELLLVNDILVPETFLKYSFQLFKFWLAEIIIKFVGVTLD